MGQVPAAIPDDLTRAKSPKVDWPYAEILRRNIGATCGFRRVIGNGCTGAKAAVTSGHRKPSLAGRLASAAIPAKRGCSRFRQLETGPPSDSNG
jgi:hypothetical protein